VPGEGAARRDDLIARRVTIRGQSSPASKEALAAWFNPLFVRDPVDLERVDQ